MRTLVCLASLAALTLAPAAGLASPAFSYDLGTEAAIQQGCFGPCACAVLIQSPLEGTFTLDPDGADGSFQLYRVLDVRWVYKSSDGARHQVTGSGTYRVADDQQQLIVDLSVDGAAAERFDSGLTGGGSSFPHIRVPIARNAFSCFDTVYGVDANPAPTSVGEPAASSFELFAKPNPFRGVTDLKFSASGAGPLEIRIHDLAGRVVRTFTFGFSLGGPRGVTWDGRDSRGARVAAGIYFVRLRDAGRTSRITLVKVE